MVVISPVFANWRSSTAFVVVVVPWTIRSICARSAPASPNAFSTPPDWFGKVVGTLANRTAPVAGSKITRSVKVPPTSTPATSPVIHTPT